MTDPTIKYSVGLCFIIHLFSLFYFFMELEWKSSFGSEFLYCVHKEKSCLKSKIYEDCDNAT